MVSLRNLAMVAIVASIAPTVHAQRYHVHTYTESDGLPSSMVMAVTQGEDGRMWFATRSGIAVYDGQDWEIAEVPPALRHPDEALTEWDARANLWTLHRDPPYRLHRFDGVTWSEVPEPEGTAGVATSIGVRHEADDLRVVIGTASGRVLVWDDRSWHVVDLDSGTITAVAFDARRTIAATAKGLWVLDESTPDWSANRLGDRHVLGMSGDFDGRVWLVGGDWIGHLKDDRISSIAERLDLPEVGGPSQPLVVRDGRGGLFLGYRANVLYFHPDRGIERLGHDSGLIADGATSLRVDREGMLWAGTTRGLSKLVSRRFANYGFDHGLFDDEVSAVVEQRLGRMVLGHVGGLTIWEGGGDEPRLTQIELPGRVLDLAADPAGNVWIADEAGGVGHLDEGGAVHWHGEMASEARSVLVAEDGTVWAASKEGLFRSRGEPFERFPIGDPRVASAIRRLFSGSDGALYLATAGHGVWRIDGRHVHRWTAGDPAGDNVFAVLEEPDGTIRVGTLGGLFEVEGNRLVRAAAPGPVVSRPVYFMTRDIDGRLWLGTDNGVIRWDGENPRHFTVANGLVGRESNRAAGVVDSRGRVWIGMDRGLSVYRPELDEPHVVPPLLELLEIEIADRRVPMTRPAKLKHRENTLVFRFRATSFVDERRVQVRTWLQGFDPDWMEPQLIARGEIRYTHLPPGRYRFHVQAANADGVWSEVRRSAPIVIQVPIWRQPWIVLIGVVLAAGLAYGLHRVAAQRRYARTLEREVEEQIAALRRSEERVHRVQQAEMRRLDLTLGSIADGVIATDRLGRVILINPAASDITGWSPFDAVGRSIREVLPLRAKDDAATEIDPMTIPDRVQRHVDHDVLLPDPRGRVSRLIEITGAPMMETEHQPGGIVLAFRDVTVRRRTEEELARTDRLEALGVLAGGIAHDFNNLMTVMLGSLSLLKLDGEVSLQNRTTLSNAEAAVLRARDLTQQLLTFSRGGAPVRQAAPISEVIEESATFIVRGSNLHPEIDLPTDLWVVEIDSGQMSQVINNLLINAGEAMPDGGTVRISGRNLERAPGTLPEGRYIEITIRDEGHGISAEHVDRIFDPYFSTKQRGSGLGLATAYSIVARHDGLLTVESAMGHGTIFRIYLPASVSAVEPQDYTEVGTIAGRGRILVMDDEHGVRDVVGAMLERLGYTVTQAADGDQAIARYRDAMERGARFDVVIMDLTIPGGKGGREAVGELLEIDPGVRAIVASGYSNDPVLAEYERHGFRGCLAKPFHTAQMAKIVRQVMETPDPKAG